MKKPIDITIVRKTRDGRNVRIYSIDSGGNFPIHGAIYDINSNSWNLVSWRESGSHLTGPHYDLVEEETWRAWKPEEKKPMFIMLKDKDYRHISVLALCDCDDEARLRGLFDKFWWLHEDGTESPCGVKL